MKRFTPFYLAVLCLRPGTWLKNLTSARIFNIMPNGVEALAVKPELKRVTNKYLQG